jgi:hypothetical protein
LGISQKQASLRETSVTKSQMLGSEDTRVTCLVGVSRSSDSLNPGKGNRPLAAEGKRLSSLAVSQRRRSPPSQARLGGPLRGTKQASLGATPGNLHKGECRSSRCPNPRLSQGWGGAGEGDGGASPGPGLLLLLVSRCRCSLQAVFLAKRPRSDTVCTTTKARITVNYLTHTDHLK